MMKIKDGFMLREMAEQWVVVPIGNTVVDVNCIITLTPSAAILWKELEKGIESVSQLAEILTSEYEIDYETALTDCEEFINTLNEKDML